MTCTSIGAQIERMFVERGGPPVLRVDRELTRAALEVANGFRTLRLVTSLPTAEVATLGLLREEFTSPASLEVTRVPEAWAAFQQGDRTAVESALHQALVAPASPGDVVLLAQLSLAPAAEGLTHALQRVHGTQVAVLAGLAPVMAALGRVPRGE